MVSRLLRWSSPVLAALVVCSMFAPAVSADARIDNAPAGIEPLIVGGSETSVEDYPYAAYLVNDDDFQFCGGVLVDRDSVVTAAHCAQAVAAGELGVVLGRKDKHTDAGTRADVERVWIHPDFEEPWQGHDIAVLTLDHRVRYQPAELADSSDKQLYKPDTMATVVGWGRTSEGGPRSDVLRAAEVPLTSDAECKDAFDSYEPTTMVCAGYEDGGVDACQGDSGGPLLVGDTVIGIVSWGRGCARSETPGVYTRVSNYTSVIAEHT